MIALLQDLGTGDLPGVGVDVEEHSRWTSGDIRFDALFTEAERLTHHGLHNAAIRLAGIWCAKEAAVKAMSPFVTLSLRDVEIVHDASGRPGVRVLKEELRHHGDRVAVSISRTEHVSVAIAIYVPQPDVDENHLVD